ncbi:cysteine-rich venom protein Cau1-like [Theristicus caerulescens]
MDLLTAIVFLATLLHQSDGQYNSYQTGCAVAYCPRNQFNYFCVLTILGNDAMQIATPYKSRPKCADCPGHCDRGLCTNPCKYLDFFGNCINLKILFSCNHLLVKEKGPATCRCTTQIIQCPGGCHYSCCETYLLRKSRTHCGGYSL